MSILQRVKTLSKDFVALYGNARSSIQTDSFLLDYWPSSKDDCGVYWHGTLGGYYSPGFEETMVFSYDIDTNNFNFPPSVPSSLGGKIDSVIALIETEYQTYRRNNKIA